jgi:prevent-host-death family protein
MTVSVKAPKIPRITRDTSDTFVRMADVTIRELRNNGGEIVDRAAHGEHLVITRSGRPVAELRPLRRALSAEELVDRWRHLPRVDPVRLRADLDELLDWRL